MAANVVLPLAQDQRQPPAWAWATLRGEAIDDDSWEARAFAEDATSLSGGTWPPRSYACNFCRREFRSAQALGGHMNVHRRDRARLRQSSPSSDQSSPTLPAPSAISQQGDYPASLCLFYPMPASNPNLASSPLLSPTSMVSTSSLMSPSFVSTQLRPSSPPPDSTALRHFPLLGSGSPFTSFQSPSSSLPSFTGQTSVVSRQTSNSSAFLEKNRRHNAPPSLHLKSESSRKKSPPRAFQPYQAVSLKLYDRWHVRNLVQESEDLEIEDLPDGLDLELRLGHKSS